MCEFEPRRRREGVPIRIIDADGTKTAVVGVMLESSFARLRLSMATSSEERTPSRPFGRRKLSAMVEIQSGCKKTVRRGGYGKESGP